MFNDLRHWIILMRFRQTANISNSIWNLRLTIFVKTSGMILTFRFESKATRILYIYIYIFFLLENETRYPTIICCFIDDLETFQYYLDDSCQTYFYRLCGRQFVCTIKSASSELFSACLTIAVLALVRGYCQE